MPDEPDEETTPSVEAAPDAEAILETEAAAAAPPDETPEAGTEGTAAEQADETEADAAAEAATEAAETDDADAFVSALDELKQLDPARAAQIEERLRERFSEPPDLEQQYQTMAASVQQNAQAARTQTFQQAQAYGNIADWTKKQLAQVQQHLDDLANDRADKVDASVLKPDEMAQQLTGHVMRAQAAYGRYRDISIAGAITESLVAHPVYRYLTAEDHDLINRISQAQAQGSASTEEVVAGVVSVFMDRALSAAPAERKRRQAADEERVEKSAKTVERLLETVGAATNGKRRPQAKAKPQDDRTERELMADPTTPIDVVTRIRAKQRAAQ